MRIQIRTAIGPLIGLVISAGPLLPQTTVRGAVSDHETLQPLRGVFVSLTNPDGAILKAVLTDSAGRYFLQAASASQLRAEFIGRKSYVTRLRSDSAANLTINIQLESVPLQLAAVEATVAPRCAGTRGDAKFAAALWEEAKKALRVSSWYQDKLEVFSATYHRVLDEHGIQVLSERTQRSWGRRSPFAALNPDTLARVGFARPATADTMAFFGVDAAVLISDAFVAGHCFWTDTRKSADSLLALRFRPIRDEGRADVAGTIWVDRKTSELRLVEYSYVNTDAFAGHPAGGKTWFQRLPDGTWITDRWSIRLPLLRRGLNADILRSGFGETGGHVIEVRAAKRTGTT